jgi:polysaccharide export outer membrane protein
MLIPRRRTLFLPIAAALLAAACSSSPPATRPAPAPDPGLRSGDAVRVSVWREPDVSGTFRVDDRGVVTLPLLGERQVQGMQGPALRDTLLADYRQYLQNPSIEVTVLRRINILGAVNKPGLYPVDATISLVEALGMAGGVSPTGNPDDIRLARDGRVIYEDLDRAALVGDIDVRSGDRIVVGEKSWLERNPGALIGSLLGAAVAITVALTR